MSQAAQATGANKRARDMQRRPEGGFVKTDYSNYTPAQLARGVEILIPDPEDEKGETQVRLIQNVAEDYLLWLYHRGYLADKSEDPELNKERLAVALRLREAYHLGFEVQQRVTVQMQKQLGGKGAPSLSFIEMSDAAKDRYLRMLRDIPRRVRDVTLKVAVHGQRPTGSPSERMVQLDQVRTGLDAVA